MESTEEARDGNCSELFQPLHDHDLAITDVDATDKHVETVKDEGGVEVTELRDGHDAHQGRQVDGFVQGCLKDPRDAPQVQRDCFLICATCLERDVRGRAIHYPAKEQVVNCPAKRRERSECGPSNKEGISEWCDEYYGKKIKDSVKNVLDRVPGSPHRPPPSDRPRYAPGGFT